MNNISTLIYLFIFLLSSCAVNRQKDMGDPENLGKIADSVLLSEIDAFMDECLTINSLKVILVTIDDSLLYISPDIYYECHGSTGYSLYREKLVGFYITSAGDWGLIDTTLLTKGAAKGYPDKFPENDPAFDSLEYKYDYRMRKYRIHSKDSLELLFWGYW